jgi:hypothetical protein
MAKQNPSALRDIWILELTNEKLVPHLVLLERVDDSNWEAREDWWMKEMLRLEQPLTNQRRGGGGYGRNTGGKTPSLETRKKMSEAHKGLDNHQSGRKHSPQAIEKIKTARAKQTYDETYKQKMSASITLWWKQRKEQLN